ILGMADLLAETRLDDEQKRYLQVFRGASENLLSLINDILDLAKIEAGQLDLEETEFDFKETIDMVVGIISPRARQKGLPLLLNIEQPPGNYLRGDPVRLRQVLLNIMSNAVKFSSKGVIRIDAKFKLADKSAEVEIAVADEGIGIPKEKQHFLFERFKQADASVTRQFGGTGLGLAISRMLVDKMGGNIRLESKPGKGSTFIITVQFKMGSSKDVVPDERNLAGMSILVYFEDESERGRVAGLLENTGALVRLAVSENQLVEELSSASVAGAHVTVILTYCDVKRGNACKLAAELGHKLAGTGSRVKILTIASGGICITKPEEKGLETNCCLVSPVGGRELIRELRKIWAVNHKTDVSGLSGSGSHRILLVEDAKDNQLLMKAYLKKSPYEIELAENGQEAVEKYMAGVFDLVLMDVQMPVKDGYTATKEIRAYEKKNNKRRTPIIALTANAYQEDVNNSIHAGCDAHMTKPIKKDKLLTAVEAVFRKA
ncbi:MAG: response regulator, partial [Candidatus Nitrosotenuis sp.]